MEGGDFQQLQKLLPGVKRNISLKNYTTFKIGGPAQYFFIAKKSADFIKAILVAKKLKIPFFIFGGGSNVLVSDRGFKGLIIKIQNTKYQIPHTRASSVRGRQNIKLYAEAGVLMSTLVRETTKRGLAGLEWAGGLPGTLGGAIRGNAGAFGGETKDSVLRVEVLDGRGKKRKLSKKQCKFSYRSSLIKRNKWILLSAVLKLKKGDKKKLQSIVKNYIKYRKEKHPMEYPNAGSIFKNCDFKKIPKILQNQFSHAVKTDPFPVVPTAYILSEAGLKGKKIGQVQISEKHPNYIVNLGGARAKDVKKLIHFVKEKIKKKFGIDLEEEIQFVGF